jgi:DinB superfamily
MALTLPKFIPRLIFGSANRASRSYEELVQKYQGKLASGGKASGRFLPTKVSFEQRDDLIKKLSNLVEGLNKRVEKLSETDFDEYVLPHPILGKLTLREMLYFTIYHVEHHHVAAKRNLTNP